MEEQVNYKELYLKMVRASEKAIQTLISVQQECEELYLSAGETHKLEHDKIFLVAKE